MSNNFIGYIFGSADRQCDLIDLLPSNDSGPIALVDDTVMFSVNMTSQEPLDVRLTTTRTSDDGYIFKINTNTELFRVQSSVETSLKAENTPNILGTGWRTLWVDYRSTGVILGSGNDVVLNFNDTANHQNIYYIKFERPSNKQTILLCNRKGNDLTSEIEDLFGVKSAILKMGQTGHEIQSLYGKKWEFNDK